MIGLALVTGLTGLLSLLITVVFLWKAYKHGGKEDLAAAAHALRDARPHRLTDITAGLNALKRQPTGLPASDRTSDGTQHPQAAPTHSNTPTTPTEGRT